MRASAVSDLPQPDSPTRHSVSPWPSAKEMPRTACSMPAGRRDVDAQVFDREQAHAAAPDHGDITSPTPTRSPVAGSAMMALGQA